MDTIALYNAAAILRQELKDVPGVLAVYPDRNEAGVLGLRVQLFESEPDERVSYFRGGRSRCPYRRSSALLTEKNGCAISCSGVTGT